MRVLRAITKVLAKKLRLKTPKMIDQSKTVFEAIQVMSTKRLGALIVCDEAGKLSGIFTERDYLNKIAVQGLFSKPTGTPLCLHDVFIEAHRKEFEEYEDRRSHVATGDNGTSLCQGWTDPHSHDGETVNFSSLPRVMPSISYIIIASDISLLLTTTARCWEWSPSEIS